MTQRTAWALYTRVTLLVLFSWSLLVVMAPIAKAEGCGDIVAPRYIFEVNGDEVVRRSIENCTDPFLVTTTPPNPYVLYIDGQAISSGMQVQVQGGGNAGYRFYGRTESDVC